MAAIQFPNNPSAGDLFVAGNGIRYTYDGEKWKTLGTSTVGTEGQFLETPTTLTINKVITANTNTGAVGALAINSGVVLTVPSTSTFRTLTGKSGTGGGGASGLPTTGGTMTGFLTLNADPTAILHAATKQYVDSKAVLVADGGNFDSGASLVSTSTTYDGGSFD